MALRDMRRAPAFPAVAILVLALGISANITLFGLFDNLVLRQLPVPSPERLVSFDAIDQAEPEELPTVLPFAALRRFDESNRVFTTVASFAAAGMTLQTIAGFTNEGVAFVSGRFFDVLEVRPALGRLIDANDVKTGARVAVMTSDYWQLHYSGSPHVIGTEIKLQGIPFSVIGISAPGFTGMNLDYVTAFVVPATTAPLLEKALGDPGDGPIPMEYGLGRLRPGINLAEARSELQGMWPSIRASLAPPNDASQQRKAFLALRLDVNSARRGFSLLREWWTRPLSLLVATTLLLLVIACLNLAALATARMILIRSDVVTKSALGAPRWRLAQEQFIQSGLITACSVAAAVALGRFAVNAIGPVLFYWHTDSVPTLTLRPDWPMAIGIMSVLIGVGFAIGIIPALCVSDRGLQESLRQGRATSMAIGRWSTRLVVLQVSGATLLLIVSGLFSKSLSQLRRADAGLKTANVLIANLARQPGWDPASDPATYSNLLRQRLEQVPGVQCAAFSNVPPMMGLGASEWTSAVVPANASPDLRSVSPTVVSISPQFFKTLGIALRGGRDFSWHDDSAHPPVAIVSKALAVQLFGGARALGQQIRIGTRTRVREVSVVGIADDVRLLDLHAQAPLLLYLPLLQGATTGSQWPSSIVIRGTGVDLSSLQPVIRTAIESLGQDFVLEQNTLRNQIERSLVRDRVEALGANIFGVAATALVMLGLWGVIGLMVSSRTREIGIRAALGADPSGVRNMVLWQAARLASCGLAIGLPAGWLALRWIASTLVAASPQDPLIFVRTILTIMAVSVISPWVPANRAAAVDPMQAIRFE